VFELDYAMWGAAREAAIHAARVVLNVHFYETAALEVHRVNHLLALGKCVVSEPSSDAALDAHYAAGAVADAPAATAPATAADAAAPAPACAEGAAVARGALAFVPYPSLPAAAIALARDAPARRAQARAGRAFIMAEQENAGAWLALALADIALVDPARWRGGVVPVG
jgi:hypothetical protein